MSDGPIATGDGGAQAPAETSAPPGSANVGDKNPPNKKGNSRKRKRILGVLTLVFIAVGIAYGVLWFLVLSLREVTDDAYVGGNLVTLTPQVAGTVVAILADETQLVRVGQDVVHLEPTDAAVALDQARTALAETVRQVRQQFELADQNSAVVAQRRLELARAQDDYDRRAPLLATRAIPAEDVAHARNALETARAMLAVADKQAAASRVLVSDTSIEQHPSVERAKANFRQAYIATQRNALVAPVTGYIAKRSVQVGEHVAVGASLMTIVPLADLWIDANFKEHELRNIRIGQPATVEADLYGSHVEYQGRVIGLGAGTGGAFALLPPQNASGNWIKVVQRVPVRIALDANALADHPLRIGLSTTVKVDTHDRSGAMLAEAPVAEAGYRTTVFDKQAADADRIADDIVRANLGRMRRSSVASPQHG